jgi:ribosomal protein L32
MEVLVLHLRERVRLALARLAVAPGWLSGGGRGLQPALAGFDAEALLPRAAPAAEAGGLWDVLVRMAVPKKKTSHARKATRSAHKGVELARNISTCRICGGPRLLHQLCPSCLKAQRNVLPTSSSSSSPPQTAPAPPTAT